MPAYNLIGNLLMLVISKRQITGKSRFDHRGGRVDDEADPAQAGTALNDAADARRQGNNFGRTAQDELARMNHERFDRWP